MGQDWSRSEETNRELKQIADQTNFSLEEVHGLYRRYIEISNSVVEDQKVHKEEFRKALGVTSSFMIDRLFELFDTNCNGTLDFKELCFGLSHFCPNASVEEKIDFSFKIYDLNNDGRIQREDLIRIVDGFLIDQAVPHTPEQVSQIVENTFRQADTKKDGWIDYEEYKAMVMKRPQILASLTLATWNLPLDDY